MENGILQLFLVFLTGFTITYIAIPSILEVAYKKKLFDVPDDRKVHTQQIPSLGGIGLFIGVILTFIVWSSASMYTSSYFKFLLTGYLILFFMGLKDDLVIMRTRYKFIIQFFVAGMLAYGGMRFMNLHGILGIHELPYWFSFAFSVIFIVGITNAFNLIDGIDGLAGGLGGINCLTLGALLYVFEQYDFANLAFAVGGSLLAFLRYNFSSYPNKIFMGDTGSLLLGLTVSVLAIAFVNLDTIAVAKEFRFVSPPIVVLGIMIIPIFDTIRVILVRLSKGKSPFTPDKNHIHHAFLAEGVSHKKASIILYVVNILLILTVLIFRSFNALLLGLLLLVVGTFLIQVLLFFRFRNRDHKMEGLKIKLDNLKQENQFVK